MDYVLLGIAGLTALIALIIGPFSFLVRWIGDRTREREQWRRQEECVHTWDESGCICTQCGYENHDWESDTVWFDEVCPHCGGNELRDCEFCGVDGTIQAAEHRLRCRRCDRVHSYDSRLLKRG